MPNIVITGAGSGLGHAFVNEYAKDPSNHIYALDKYFPPNWLSSSTLSSEQSAQNIHATTLDITNESDLLNFTANLSNHPAAKSDGIDIVIHSAGIRGLVPSIPISSYAEVSHAETYSAMTTSTLQGTFSINTIGTFLLIRALLPLLLQASPARTPKVIIMGSRMGSMSSNVTGGGYAYRASKAALNAIVKSFSIDVPDVTFLVVHPGRVQTGLVPVREDGAFSSEEVMGDLMGLVERVDGEWSGRFVDRFGEAIGW